MVSDQIAHQLPQGGIALALDLLLGGHRQQPIKVLGQGGAAEVTQAQLAQGLDHLVGIERLPVTVVVLVQQVGGIQLAQTIQPKR